MFLLLIIKIKQKSKCQKQQVTTSNLQWEKEDSDIEDSKNMNITAEGEDYQKILDEKHIKGEDKKSKPLLCEKLVFDKTFMSLK